MRDNKVVERIGEADQSAREDTRHQLVDDDLVERLKRRAAEVESGIIEALIRSADTRHDVEHDERNAEADM